MSIRIVPRCTPRDPAQTIVWVPRCPAQTVIIRPGVPTTPRG
ncbi:MULTISPECIES: hypothetical protein [unclassified Kutzneria]|nr:hypothetical protein [Kutzneria sp. 744]